MTQTFTTDLLVIGAGPAGYTAAIYAARGNMKPILVSGLQPGGQLTITTDVENYPGFAEAVQGPWLMEQMAAQAEHVGTRVIADLIVDCDLQPRRAGEPFRLVGDGGDVYLARTVVIATGAQARWLGLPAESRLHGAGVSACATCDGFFYRGKAVAVVGGGNTAVEEALFLTSFASRVTLVHRKGELRAERILQDRLFANPKIEVVWDSEVDEILGSGEPATVSGVRLKNGKTGATREIAVDGVFIAIGHAPASELFTGQLPVDPSGYLLVEPGRTATRVPGVYAAGDVTDHVYRQAVTAAGQGCMAALEVARLLAEEDHARAHHPLAHQEAEKIGVW